ncbi:hypothetical protein VTK73DRAFT_4433 [Phialemonium thermophilum]|uniref:Uncharacterized protein n=1 Tax=Phialemonium thermophilum TaxID=223376 RepID=A0ABR3V8Y0_9PEZI
MTACGCLAQSVPVHVDLWMSKGRGDSSTRPQTYSLPMPLNNGLWHSVLEFVLIAHVNTRQQIPCHQSSMLDRSQTTYVITHSASPVECSLDVCAWNPQETPSLGPMHLVCTSTV